MAWEWKEAAQKEVSLVCQLLLSSLFAPTDLRLPMGDARTKGSPCLSASPHLDTARGIEGGKREKQVRKLMPSSPSLREKKEGGKRRNSPITVRFESSICDSISSSLCFCLYLRPATLVFYSFGEFRSGGRRKESTLLPPHMLRKKEGRGREDAISSFSHAKVSLTSSPLASTEKIPEKSSILRGEGWKILR